jgi:SAM-dependent methyltransferase
LAKLSGRYRRRVAESAGNEKRRRSAPGALRALARRGVRAADQAIFPEAGSGVDQWQRIVLNQAIDDHLATLDPSTKSAVEISGEAHRNKGWKEYCSLNYPEFDLCDPAPQGRTFDVVICEQVLEHVRDPWRAVATLRDLCSPRGRVIVSTPFLIKVHELPMYGMHDYWRFTPRGLRLLLETSGLTVDRVETWGNKMCVVGNLDRWSSKRPWHSLRNRRDVAMQVWAFATKTG